MKLDKIRFATLIGYLSRISGQTFAVDEIVEIDGIIDMPIPEPAAVVVNTEQLHVLMALMREGTRKIEAIKQHRMMTGYGLKESKDAVEKYWPVDKISVNKDRLLKNINDLSIESLDDRQINAVYKYIEANIY